MLKVDTLIDAHGYELQLNAGYSHVIVYSNPEVARAVLYSTGLKSQCLTHLNAGTVLADFDLRLFPILLVPYTLVSALKTSIRESCLLHFACSVENSAEIAIRSRFFSRNTTMSPADLDLALGLVSSIGTMRFVQAVTEQYDRQGKAEAAFTLENKAGGNRTYGVFDEDEDTNALGELMCLLLNNAPELLSTLKEKRLSGVYQLNGV